MACRVMQGLDAGKGALARRRIGDVDQMQADVRQIVPAGQLAGDHPLFARLHGIKICQPVFVGVQWPVIANLTDQLISLL
ncbi:hypothetical protein D3C75_941170 [compost metagenome]